MITVSTGHQTSWLSRGSTLSGIFSVLLGSTVLVGWYSGTEILIQIRPEFAPMQYNTAFGFLLFGLALLGTISGKTRLALVSGSLVASLGLLTLIEYVFLLDLGIDELFMEHYITIATSHPGRMAPNTALCFLLSGSVIVLAARDECGSRRNPCLGLVGSIVTALGLIALFGYISDIPTAYGWGQLTHMAMHASVGFIIVGSGLSLRAFHIGSVGGERIPAWLPLFFGLGVLTVTILMWQALSTRFYLTESVFPGVVLTGGIVAALLLSVSIWLSQKAWSQADQLTKANEKLKKWELVFKHAKWGIVITDPASDEIISVNAAIAEMHGYSEEELHQINQADLFSEEDRALLPERTSQVQDKGHLEYESMHKRKDDSLFPVLESVVAIYDEGGNVLYRVSNVQDITESRQVKEALLLTQFAVDNNMDPIYWVRADGRIRYANSAACEILGYTRDELESMTVSEIDPDFPIEAWPDHWLEMKKEGSVTFEAHHQRKSGDVFPVAIRTSFIEFEGEEYIWAFVRDVTGRKAAEAETIRLSTVVEQAPVAIYITDLDGCIIYANPHTQTSSGYSFAELEGRTPAILKSNFQDDALYQKLWDTISSGNTWTGILVNKDKDGNMYHESSTIFPIKNPDGEIINYAAVKRDITARVKLNDERDRLLEKIREQARTEKENQQLIQRQDRLAAVGQLASGIAHDFNNIMAVIILYAFLLLKTPEITAEMKKRLSVISDQAEMASDLTQQILDFARRSTLDHRAVDLNSILEDAVKLLEHTIPENIRTTFSASRDEYIVTADPARIQQVIMNLALNARDAMPEGGELRITLERKELNDKDELRKLGLTQGEWMLIKVADNGRGISPEHIEHIFDPFFTTKPVGEGTGLGLAQVYGIMKQHDGHIDVYSEEGKGTTFSCYLPCSIYPQPDDSPLELKSSAEGHGETVLLVEDNTILRKALVESLESLNFKVRKAANGMEALEILEKNSALKSNKDPDSDERSEQRIEMVLSDMVMPEMGGEELFTEMRQRGLTIPFVLLSGHPFEKQLEDLEARGLSGWMSKPLVPEQLGRLISQLLSADQDVSR